MPTRIPNILFSLLLLGACAQIVQALLVREGLVVFHGNEVTLGAFYGSWLLWLAVGSLLVVRYRQAGWVRAASVSLQWLLLALPIMVALTVVALRLVRLLLDASAAQFVALGDLFLALFLITLPVGLLLGVSFPLACRALAEASLADASNRRAAGAGTAAVGIVSRLYVADALGALVGGAGFTWMIVQGLGVVTAVGLVCVALAVCARALGRGDGPRRGLALVIGLAGVVLMLPPVSASLDLLLERQRFATLQPGLELLDVTTTRYGHLAVGRLGDQISVVADGQVRESFPLPLEVRRDAAYLLAQAPDAKRILSLGGLASGLSAELLRYPVERLDQVEQDRRGFNRIEPYLPPETRAVLTDPRVRVHFEDGRHLLGRLSPEARYDLILALHDVPSNAAGNRFFTEELYQQVAGQLTPNGVFCTRVAGASNYVGRTVGSYAGSVYQTLRTVFAEVAIQPGDVLILCGALKPGVVSEEPVVLERRLRALQSDGDPFPAEAFYSMMPADEIAYLRARFDEAEAAVNSDDRPVTYYLNMLLWGRFSASGCVDWMERLRTLGPWPYLLPFGLLLVLGLLRSGLEGSSVEARSRRAGVFALFLLGVVAMAVQLALLLGYQSRVGFMFERFALLNGLFMTGLALGAVLGQRFAGGRRAAGVLMGLLAVTGLGVLTLPWLFDWLAGLGASAREAGFWGLCLASGLLTGSGFPLGVGLARGDAEDGADAGDAARSGGLIQAADNLGGSIGGLVTGALLVPILGVTGTVVVLAALCGLAVVALGAARLRAGVLDRPRLDTSLPWRNPSWALLFIVLLVYGWTLLVHGSAPAPRVQFEPERLAAVSGSETFEQREEPFIHYLGAEQGGAVETAALSTMAAAAEIRGFAGPVNLLLAVDKDGRLRGVQYVTSRETPAYIAGIDTWLAGLAGADLGNGPLSLEHVDGLSGATVTSRAALDAINRSASRVSRLHFGTAMPPLGEAPETAALDPAVWVTFVLLLAFFPLYLSGSERGRLLFQALSLGILGLWLNTLVTEIDLINLSLGHAATPAQNPQRWLLWGFVAVSGLLFGQVWCGYVCPFGIVQEWISRIGRRLGLRCYPDRHLEQPLRYVKFLLLSLMLILVWLSGDSRWAAWDPMQYLFGGDLGRWMLMLTGLVLLACLFYVRFWCRYLCPVGALLALTNKLAWLQRYAPARRFEHCDLGVKAEHDLDCIRCNRCLSGVDTRLRSRHDDSCGRT